jgi:hypothetical protein
MQMRMIKIMRKRFNVVKISFHYFVLCKKEFAFDEPPVAPKNIG